VHNTNIGGLRHSLVVGVWAFDCRVLKPAASGGADRSVSCVRPYQKIKAAVAKAGIPN